MFTFDKRKFEGERLSFKGNNSKSKSEHKNENCNHSNNFFVGNSEFMERKVIHFCSVMLT